MFARTFSDGMALVEETANYLDGDGRKTSKELTRDAALAYAGASMRLTTQLMQIASWLLVLRAVREGEMAVHEAADAKYRINSDAEPNSSFEGEGLPDRLVSLVGDTRQLYDRIARLDVGLFAKPEEASAPSDAVAQQRALLKAFSNG